MIGAKVKWYNDPQLVGALLLFWPQAGLYGLYKSDVINPRWKHLGYGTLAVFCVLLLLYFLG